MTKVCISEGDFNSVEIDRDVEQVEDVTQMCFDAMLALGFDVLNVLDAFNLVAENVAEILCNMEKFRTKGDDDWPLTF